MGPTQLHLAQELNKNFNNFPNQVNTPIKSNILMQELKNYPDPLFANNLIKSFKFGFDIGYVGPSVHHISKNLKSAAGNETAVSNCILKELKQKRVAGPFQKPPLQPFRTSPIGIVPKKNGDFRMITDLSQPFGHSVNDFISAEDAAVQFTKFDKATEIVAKLGVGCLMAKMDIRSAFRLCPVRKEDWNLLGFTHLNLFFVDLCLPFGCRSSVNRFTRLSNTLLWILQHNYGLNNIIHYLDDFFLATVPNKDLCSHRMNLIKQVFNSLGVPLAEDKTVGPATTLTYLGIELDSVSMELRLPAEKHKNLLRELQAWEECKKCTKRQLLSLIGQLAFAAKVIPSGRTFLRRLIDLSCTVKKLSYHITLNKEARLDIKWWLDYLPTWNGSHKIIDPQMTPAPSIELFTDASSLIGFGIFFRQAWVSEGWPRQFEKFSIQWKELFPIYVACVLWGSDFKGKRILFHCDNQAVVDIWSNKASKSSEVSALLRKLFFIAANNEFVVKVAHIAGINNSIADSLSRSQIATFRRLAPNAELNPTCVPQGVWDV